MSRASWIEETTTSIAGTSGDGAVTLTQVTGLPRFSHAFGTGARMVEYTIEDTVNLKFEEGLGSVASNVLTRTKVRATWDGTTYDDTAPAALQFGGSPTSGNIRIRMAPHAHEFIPAPPAIVTTVGSPAYQGYQLSGHGTVYGDPDAYTLATNTEYYFPFLCLIRGQVDGVGVDVIGAAASSGIKIGLYEVGADGLAGPNIVRFNEIASTSTGWKTDTTPGTWAGNAGPLRFGVGFFWLGILTNNASVAISRNSRTANWAMAHSQVPRQNGYGFGAILTKAAENSYATGLPSGTPAGSYTMDRGDFLYLGLRINN